MEKKIYLIICNFLMLLEEIYNAKNQYWEKQTLKCVDLIEKR